MQAFRSTASPTGCGGQPDVASAEVGCWANVIMAVLGHKSLSEAEQCTRDADQARLAEAGIVSLPVRITDNLAQTTPEQFG